MQGLMWLSLSHIIKVTKAPQDHFILGFRG